MGLSINDVTLIISRWLNWFCDTSTVYKSMGHFWTFPKPYCWQMRVFNLSTFINWYKLVLWPKILFRYGCCCCCCCWYYCGRWSKLKTLLLLILLMSMRLLLMMMSLLLLLFLLLLLKPMIWIETFYSRMRWSTLSDM